MNRRRLAGRLARAVIPARLRPVVKRALRIPSPPRPPLVYWFKEAMAWYPTERQHYRWGTLCAASLARALAYERISVIEFGVAGGNGLLALEEISSDASRAFGVAIDVYGFDTGTGLPKPRDYRDLPQLWREGFYTMDVDALRRRLTSANLVLGPVSETVPAFVATNPAPVGFISFDMDLYSSTMDAFQIFDGDSTAYLPRVTCYFDDIHGFSHGDFNGERLAISDFNEAHRRKKISKLYGLRYALDIDRAWTDMMYMFHDFDHEKYSTFDGTNPFVEIPLDPD